MQFPVGFVWGAATAAYQIEGAVGVDGRTRSIWDTFSHTPGRVLGGDTGDVAVDHYHRYREDVALMSSLGLSAYRFSIAWTRVQPTGTGPASQLGLDFYRRLVDELLTAGIQPWPTLYHWDLPQELEDRGGWPERETAYRFAEYAAAVHAAIGDRVHDWATVNEPWCAAFAGYASGEHAPGRREPASALRAAHHLLLAHGLAAAEMSTQRPENRIGLAVNLYPVAPASDAEADVDAARRIDGLQNRLFLDPLMYGRYPTDLIADVGAITDFGHVHDQDLAVIGVRPDLLGINYYSPFTVSGRADTLQRLAPSSPVVGASPWVGSEHVRFLGTGRPVTSMGWEIEPPGLRQVLERLRRDYPQVPLYVTENGAAFDDVYAGENGTVRDPQRVAYLDAHLRACHDAITAGVPLRGYFAWSLLDNFEWAWGYSKRFGLVYVDFATQRRILKDSAHWYAGVIRRGGLPAPGPLPE
ncbi:MAG TPA: GH1 family beta-glucosidase [Pseudonocardiaceae bacterium]|nr:GH1 family beta-glucosidase [Pseudonocardiaceae bacterium]